MKNKFALSGDEISRFAGRVMRKRMYKFMSPKLIFTVDFVLSVLASFIIIHMVAALSASFGLTRPYGFVLEYLGLSAISTIVAGLTFRPYKTVIRHSSAIDLIRLLVACALKSLLILLPLHRMVGNFLDTIYILIGDFVLNAAFIFIERAVLISIYDSFRNKANEILDRKRVLVYGTSDKSVSAVTRLEASTHYLIVGFFQNSQDLGGVQLMGKPVYFVRDSENLLSLANKLSVRTVLFANEDEALRSKDLVNFCAAHNIKTLVVPTIDEVVSGKVMSRHVREVRIEDLLGRDEIHLNMEAIITNFRDKVVMVTGAAGSIGSELCRQLATFGVRKLILFDNAETPMHNIRLELEERYPELDFVPIIGDVRQIPRLDFAFRVFGPQVVFHAAAYKHVPLMEDNPCEAVLVNVFGSRNVADKCIEYGVEKMVMVSTDKAVNPTNIMGCTKRLAEIYVQSLGLAIERGEREGRTKFVTTRFGNVLGSNGSVIPRFREQIEKGGPVTVTHPDITRFFMTIPEACRLMMEAATMSSGNQIYVFDMGESVKIDDLAKRMIELAGLQLGRDIEIEYTGLRPGEKLYEEVLSNKENTEPTLHERIRIAKVREYGYEHALQIVAQLFEFAYNIDVPSMVKLMKSAVPEYKSMNSQFEAYDYSVDQLS